LGFKASGGPPAPIDGHLTPVTAIVGAAVAANLTVLALAMWRDRQPRDRLAGTKAQATLESLATPH
jgi:hypothetical protein